MRVLVVEDEAVLAAAVARGLRHEGMAVDVSHDGADALARRSRDPLPPVLERGDVRLDPARREATRGGHFLRLTRKEFGVLEVLLAADGAVVSAEELLERVWDEHADPFTNTVRVTIMNLRRKLGRPPLIETVTGVGYRL